MIPQDLMSALGGGGAPPAPAPGGVPPELMALLGGGPEEPPAEETAPPDPSEILQEMIELAQLYMQIDPDEEDKATMAKVLATLQKYLADEQKEQDDLLQGKVSPRAMRRATAGYGA